MKPLDSGLLDVLLLSAFIIGSLAILCSVICVAVLLVVHVFEEVERYRRWRK